MLVAITVLLYDVEQHFSSRGAWTFEVAVARVGTAVCCLSPNNCLSFPPARTLLRVGRSFFRGCAAGMHLPFRQQTLALEAMAEETNDPSRKAVTESRLYINIAVFEALVAIICATGLCRSVYGWVCSRMVVSPFCVFCADDSVVRLYVATPLGVCVWTMVAYMHRMSRMLFALGRRGL